MNATDEANRKYYNEEMLVRHVRVAVEVDVEWRPDSVDTDPFDYAKAVLQTELLNTSVRLLNPVIVGGCDFIGEPRKVDHAPA